MGVYQINHEPRQSERGNIIFYILIAVALLASFIYVVSNSGSGSVQKLNDQKARAIAAEIIEYGEALANATAQLRLRGVKFDELSFANDFQAGYEHTPIEPNAHRIYEREGGGVLFRETPIEASSTGTKEYTFNANNEIAGIGTDCAAATCSDLIVNVTRLKREVCIAMNEILGVDNPGGEPPFSTGFNISTPLFTGTAGYSDTIGDEASDAAVIGKKSACVLELPAGCGTNDCYTYFRVLWAQ